jgi:hypothetical protein
VPAELAPKTDELAQQIDALAPKTDDAPTPETPAGEELRDILEPDPEGPDATTATPFHDPTLAAGPSKEWLAKIDSVLRPEANPPVAFGKPAAQLFTTKAAVTMFSAEPPQNTQPLELVDLEAVEPPKPQVIAPAPSLAIAPQERVQPLLAHRAPVATPGGYPIVEAPDLDAPTDRDASNFDIDVDGDLTSAHTTGFDVPAKQSFISKRMLIAVLAGAAVVTVAILATRGGSQKTPARAAASEAAPVAAAPAPTPPVQQPVAAPAPQVAAAAQPATPGQIQIPVSSNPPGALVSFVDGGHAVVIGRTPTTITVDPSQPHDVALTLLDHETQLATIPAGGMTALAVDMGPAKAGAMKTAPQQVAAAAPREETPAPRKIVKREAPKHITQPAQRAETPSGKGVLMISSKPPCEIVVDGRSTHLMTPQRSIPLAPGTHTIMLVNAGMKIHKRLEVAITAKKPTKVIQDFTRR